MDKELNPVSDLCQFSAAITTHRIRLLLHFSASKMILLYYRATKTFICTASLQSIFVISTIFKKETSKGGKPQFIYGKILIRCPPRFWFCSFFVEGRKREDVKVLVLSICCQTWGVHKESWCILGTLLDVYRAECTGCPKKSTDRTKS